MSELVLAGYPVSKEDISSLSEKIVRMALDGEMNATELFVRVKGMGEAIQKAMSDDRVQDAVMRDVELYGKERKFNGATVREKEVGVRYDFSGCGDPVYEALLRERNDLDKRLKDRERFLKGLSEKMTVVDDGTGEIATVYPAVKTGKLGLCVTFGSMV